MFKLYSQENCPNCEELKSFLKAQGLTFDEVDVTSDTKARAFMIMNDLETTPAIATAEGLVFGGEISDIKSKLMSVL